MMNILKEPIVIATALTLAFLWCIRPKRPSNDDDQQGSAPCECNLTISECIPMMIRNRLCLYGDQISFDDPFLLDHIRLAIDESGISKKDLQDAVHAGINRIGEIGFGNYAAAHATGRKYFDESIYAPAIGYAIRSCVIPAHEVNDHVDCEMKQRFIASSARLFESVMTQITTGTKYADSNDTAE